MAFKITFHQGVPYGRILDVSKYLQGALRGLRTPCIQAFLHMLPALGLLWFLVDVAPLTLGLAKGVAPSAAVSALQVSLRHHKSSDSHADKSCNSPTHVACMADIAVRGLCMKMLATPD